MAHQPGTEAVRSLRNGKTGVYTMLLAHTGQWYLMMYRDTHRLIKLRSVVSSIMFNYMDFGKIFF
jgi:hypothetical protein